MRSIRSFQNPPFRSEASRFSRPTRSRGAAKGDLALPAGERGCGRGRLRSGDVRHGVIGQRNRRAMWPGIVGFAGGGAGVVLAQVLVLVRDVLERQREPPCTVTRTARMMDATSTCASRSVRSTTSRSSADRRAGTPRGVGDYLLRPVRSSASSAIGAARDLIRTRSGLLAENASLRRGSSPRSFRPDR